MPNHVTSKLVITGPLNKLQELSEFVAGQDADGEDSLFSLHQIIPQPEIYKRTVSGTSDHFGFWLVAEDLAEAKDSFMDSLLSQVMPGLKMPGSGSSYLERLSKLAGKDFATKAEAMAWVEENRPEFLEAGHAHLQALNEYGHGNWYDWRIANWGTKWDTYSISHEFDAEQCRLEYRFDTAWNIPSQAIDSIAAKFPEVLIEHKYIDEGHNFWGQANYASGKLEDERHSEDVDFEPLYLELYGELPERDEDDASEPSISDVTPEGSERRVIHVMTDLKGLPAIFDKLTGELPKEEVHYFVKKDEPDTPAQ